MVRSRSPLTGQAASGGLAGILSYGTTSRGTIIRKTPRRTAAQSLASKGSANWMRWLIRQWSALTEPQRITWAATAALHDRAPYHEYLSYNSLRWAHGHGPSKAYPAADASAPPGEADIQMIPAVGQIDIAYNDSAMPFPTWALMLFRKELLGAFNPRTHIQVIIRATAYPVYTSIVAPTGIPYLYIAKGVNADGTLGPNQGLGMHTAL